MPASEGLQNGYILAVGEDEDMLRMVDEELSLAGCNVTLHTATTFGEAHQYLVSYTYDLVLLDIEWVLRGFDLLGFDLSRISHNAGIPTVLLAARAFSPEDLRRSIEMGARVYIRSDELGSLVPFLENVLRLRYCLRISDGQIGNLAG